MPFSLHQFCMSTFLDNFSLVHADNLINLPDGAEPMADDDERLVVGLAFEPAQQSPSLSESKAEVASSAL